MRKTYMKMLKRARCFLALSLVAAVSVDAATNTVTSTADSGAGTLRALVVSANSGDTINFDNTLSGQTIQLASELWITNDMTIDASALPAGITINGNQHGATLRINYPSVVALKSLTITGGSDAGIAMSGLVSLYDCTLTSNHASGDGGGLYSYNTTLAMTRCTIISNSATAGQGGGVALFGSTAYFTNCTFTGNVASSDGGGLGVGVSGANYGTAFVNGCTFSHNTAGNAGGGIWHNGAGLVVNNSTLFNNGCGYAGGAIFNYAPMTVNQCTIVSNTAGYAGGIMVWSGNPAANAVINQCTVVGNAGGYGGGVYAFEGSATVSNSIVALNNDTGASGHDNLGDNPGGGFYVVQAGVNYTNSNPLLAPLGYHGGPTLTMPPLAGSPALDACTNGTSFTTDQRGLPRIIGSFADIGAVEENFNPVVTVVGDSGAGSLREIMAEAPAGATITFASNLSGQTILLSSGEIVVGNSMTVDGSGLAAGIVIDGNNSSRIFYVQPGVGFGLKGVTLTRGNGTGAVAGGYGGAILNQGTLTVTACTLATNSAAQGGGAISGPVTLANSTLTGNYGFRGGAIDADGTSSITHCTITGNSAGIDGGGFLNFGGQFNVTNSIIAQNSPDNISGGISGINNLTSGLPLLAALGNYGGRTPTMPPLPGSPAIDAGSDSVTSFLPTDQRGLPRSIGPHADIGAAEFVASPIVTTNLDSIPGSLRYAITYATNSSTITFAPDLSGDAITLTSGQILLTTNVTIDGSALVNGVRIQNGSDRIFQVNVGAIVSLDGLTLANANCPSAGGAILNAGGELTLNRCTLSGNQAQADGGGGAIFNDVGSVLKLNQCTLTGNHAFQQGGAVYNFNPATLTVINCTISGNTSDGYSSYRGGLGGGGIFNSGTLFVTNTIVAGNSDPYASDISGSYTGANSLTSGAPLLAALGNYGGSTQTMPPLPGSPAIDAGADASASPFATDQRGLPRLSGDHVDIGAAELQLVTASAPTDIIGMTKLGNGSVQFGFTSDPGASFRIFATTNLALPSGTWPMIGFATETPVGSGQFQFNDPQATNSPQRFYRVRSP